MEIPIIIFIDHNSPPLQVISYILEYLSTFFFYRSFSVCIFVGIEESKIEFNDTF